MAKEYFFSKEKDSILEGYIEEICSIQDEKEQVDFLGSLPKKTVCELHSYSKWKDTILEGYIEELCSIQDEKEQVAFLGSLPTKTLRELSTYSKWKLAEARKALQDAEEAQDYLQGKREEEERRFEEAISCLENGIMGGIFAGEA